MRDVLVWLFYYTYNVVDRIECNPLNHICELMQSTRILSIYCVI